MRRTAGWTRRAAIVVCAALWASCVSHSNPGEGSKVRCCQGKDVRWNASDLPLTVWFDPSLPESHVRAYQLISDQINRLAGLIVFRRGRRSPQLADRVVIPHGTVILRADGEAVIGLTNLEHNPKTGILQSATITLPELVDEYKLRYLMTHELLHALGYDHGEATTRAQFAILRAAMDLEFIRADYGDPGPSNATYIPQAPTSLGAH